jgi:hypothetical protein
MWKVQVGDSKMVKIAMAVVAEGKGKDAGVVHIYGDTSEPTIHMALESTVSPIMAVISILIEDDLLGLKSRGSLHDIYNF